MCFETTSSKNIDVFIAKLSPISIVLYLSLDLYQINGSISRVAMVVTPICARWKPLTDRDKALQRKTSTGQQLITMEQVSTGQQLITMEQVFLDFDVRPLTTPRQNVSKTN